MTWQHLNTRAVHRGVEGRGACLIKISSSCWRTHSAGQSNSVILPANLLLVRLVNLVYLDVRNFKFVNRLGNSLLTLIVRHECTGWRCLTIKWVHSRIRLAWTRRLEKVLRILTGNGTHGSLPLRLELFLSAHVIHIRMHFNNFWRMHHRMLLLVHRLNHWIVSHVVRHVELVVCKARECCVSPIVEWVELTILALVNLGHSLIQEILRSEVVLFGRRPV